MQTRVRSIAELVMKSIMLSYETFNTKTKLAAAVHNVMHGIKAKKVYPYRTIVNSGMSGFVQQSILSIPKNYLTFDLFEKYGWVGSGRVQVTHKNKALPQSRLLLRMFQAVTLERFLNQLPANQIISL